MEDPNFNKDPYSPEQVDAEIEECERLEHQARIEASLAAESDERDAAITEQEKTHASR